MASRRVLIPVVAMLTAAALAGPGAGVAGAIKVGCGRSTHEKLRATGETRAIAAELVDIPGYCYVDAPEREVRLSLDRLDQIQEDAGSELFTGMSLHSVVSDKASENSARGSTGKELGFLQLYTFTEVPPAGIDQALARASIGIDTAPEALTIAGQPVFLFVDPTSRDTRYTYTWLRHGVQGALDGARRAPMERWLAQYFAAPDLAPGETSRISQWLVPLPGYLFADYEDAGIIELFVTEPLGKVPYSVHRIADTEGQIGGLVLGEAPADLTTDQYAAALGEVTGTGEALTVGTTAVLHFTVEAGDVYVWVQDGIAGVFLSGYPAKAPAFVDALLAAFR